MSDEVSVIKKLEERGILAGVLDQVINLAVEIAREGREGRKVGTIFVVGDHLNVMSKSRPLILDPLLGHSDSVKSIHSPEVRETLKELAQLDGAFVISAGGVAVSAARYIDVLLEGIKVPLGLGSRHMAGASITKRTAAVAVVVSESSVVRIFDGGKIVSEILPEIWLMKKFGVTISVPIQFSRATDAE